MSKNQISEILSEIKKAKTAIVLAHVNPDGDTLGSMLALARVLEKAGVERVDRVMHDKVPEVYKFFPDSEKVLCSADENDRTKLLEEYDLSFSCDCGSTQRLASGAEFWSRAKQTGNIDHHLSNPHFADLNWVDAEATSTGQVVGDLVKELGVEMDRELANLMYITLLTDTGGFRHSNTNENALKWGASLVNAGADPSKLYNQLFNQIPFRAIQVLADALTKIEILELDITKAEVKASSHSRDKLRIAYTSTKRDFLDGLGADDEDTEEIVDHIMRIKGLDMCLYLREGRHEGVIKGSFRSSIDNVDCSAIAKNLDGGGHARAAGFNLDGTLDSIRIKAINELKSHL